MLAIKHKLKLGKPNLSNLNHQKKAMCAASSS
jgi:hypothetical protein